MNSIKEIETNKELIQKYNLYDTLYQDISNININENLAKLDPMNPKTKSRLYNAIHNSNYILTTPFNQLTENKAKELIYFLSNQKKNFVCNYFPQDKSWEYYSHNYKLYKNNEYMQFRGNIIPTELIPKNQYNSNKIQQNTQKRTKNNDNLIQEQNKYKTFKINNNISDNEYEKILKLKNHIYKLKSFGIDKIDEIDNIKNILENRINILNETKESFKEIKLNLKFINQLESYFNNEKTNYKPLLNIIDNDTFNNMKDYFIKRFNTTTEQILAISKLINNHIDISDIENQVLPTTEQKFCISLISKLNGSELSENQINEMSLEHIKNIITQFLNTYTPEQLNKMAKEFFEKDKKQELIEIERINNEQKEFNNNIKEQEEKQKQKEQEINFYELFRF